MPLSVQPSALGLQAQAPALVQPVDLQPALDRLHNAFKEGFITQQDIQKRTTVGNTDAEAQRKQNEAAGAKAEQDRKDQEGGKGYTKPGLFSRLTGIGTGAKPAVPKPALSPVNPNAGATEGGMEPSVMPGAAVPAPAATPTAAPAGPFSEAAASPDFNPSHESTDDLLNLVGEGGYFLQ